MYRIDLCFGGGGQETGAERKNTPTVSRSAFRKDADYGTGVSLVEFFEGDEIGGFLGCDGGLGEGNEHGAEEGDGLDFSGAGVGAGEDGAEDAGEVEGVEGRGEAAGDDGAIVRELVLGFGKAATVSVLVV